MAAGRVQIRNASRAEHALLRGGQSDARNLEEWDLWISGLRRRRLTMFNLAVHF